MAESCNKAFGRYLRTLRERRGLSLVEVQSLSQSFPDGIKKAYLSRCENGRLQLALSKLIPLSRIYEVPSDVLVERMELDMELERIGGPDTSGMTFEQMRLAARESFFDGRNWAAYGFARDSLARARVDPVLAAYRDHDEQLGVALLNCATITKVLGKYKYSFYETRFVEGSPLVGPRYLPLILERLAIGHQSRGSLEEATEASNRSIRAAEQLGDLYPLAFTYSTRAQLANVSGDRECALASYQKAFGYYRDLGHHHECAKTLNNLAEVYLSLQRYRAARSALRAAEGFINDQNQRAYVFNRLLLGEIESREDRDDAALAHWRAAARVASELQDKTLRFKSEFMLLKYARKNGTAASQRACLRRLQRLAIGVPLDTPELREYKSSLA